MHAPEELELALVELEVEEAVVDPALEVLDEVLEVTCPDEDAEVALEDELALELVPVVKPDEVGPEAEVELALVTKPEVELG